MHPFYALKPPLLLYPFRFFDPVRRRSVRARYLAERHEIEVRYARWEIIGPPEIRTGGYATTLNPSRKSPGRSSHLPPAEDPPPDHCPTPHAPPADQPPPLHS